MHDLGYSPDETGRVAFWFDDSRSVWESNPELYKIVSILLLIPPRAHIFGLEGLELGEPGRFVEKVSAVERLTLNAEVGALTGSASWSSLNNASLSFPCDQLAS